MLAYVFWHWPGAGVEPARYAEALVAFHRALAADPPRGMRGSRAWLVEPTPWLPVSRAVEDWYLVDDFAALGALNEAAITRARALPHDAVARQAAGGAGGVYRRLVSGGGEVERVSWLSKPAGVSYPDFLSRVPPGAELWQRQMVLGPAPEFALVGEPPAGVDAVTVAVRAVYPGPG
jgi:hypothetical protein